MKRSPHNSTISINERPPEASHKDAITSTDSHPSLDVEPIATTTSTTYASFYWLINYFKMCIFRLTNDVYTSFMNSWYPGRVLLPPHILHLMQVQNRLREERESHTVTCTSEDEAGISYLPKDIGYLATDREPMFVIVDSSCVSNPSSKELLIESRFHPREAVVKRHFHKNVKPVDLPSTSRDLGNVILPPLLLESDSTDELQMVDINLQSENDLLLSADYDCDNDSIVMSYLKNKDGFLDVEGTLMSTKKKVSLLDSVPKMETIVESELFNAFLMAPKPSPSLDFHKNGDKSNSIELSDVSLTVYLPSLEGSSLFSYHNLLEEQGTSTAQITKSSKLTYEEDENEKFKNAIKLLHHDNELLVAAESGDEQMIRILIEQGVNIHEMDHIGRNALHLAVCSGNLEAIALLLKAGVEPNVKDDVGMTPLSLCLMRSPSRQLAKLLFDYGAVIVPRIKPTDTGLFLQFVMMCIPTIEEERILRLLIEEGAMINDPNAPGGRQALHFAAMSNNTHLINILVELGANLFDVNHRNETPKQVAETFRCKKAYDLLEEFEQLFKEATANVSD